MPQYITQQDIIDRAGEDLFVQLSDRDGDQITDFSAVDAAILDAEAEVDSFLGQRYGLPLPGVISQVDPSLNAFPNILIRICVDLAIYRLANEHDRLTEEKRKRYDDAIMWLKKLAYREISLGVEDIPSTLNGGPEHIGPERLFTRDKMSGLV